MPFLTIAIYRHIISIWQFFSQFRLGDALQLQNGHYCRHLILVVAFEILGLTVAHAQSADTAERQIKAAFLYKFCFYVEWPSGTFSTADSPLIFGVAGDEAQKKELEQVIKSRTINGRSLEVRRVDANTSLQGLHLLFVAQSEQSNISRLLSIAPTQPLLVVTESSGGLDGGSSINFVQQDDRVRFDINLKPMELRGLHISAQLLKVARKIHGDSVP